MVTSCRPPTDWQLVEGRLTQVDFLTDKYSLLYRLFLRKRFISREEVWPKLHLLDGVRELRPHTDLQRIRAVYSPLSEQHLQDMADRNEFTPEYMSSKMYEAHFLPLVEEMLKKLVVSGAVVPMHLREKYAEVEKQARFWFQVYYEGLPMTQLERNIRALYLADKQHKHTKFEQSGNMVFKCVWTEKDQHCLEGRVSAPRDQDWFGLAAPGFRPVRFEDDIEVKMTTLRLNGDNWLARFYYRVYGWREFARLTKTNLEWRSTFIYSRMGLWMKSREVLERLSIPPDFFIEINMLTCHLYLIIQRLRASKHPKAPYLIGCLESRHKEYVDRKIGQLSIRRKNEFQKEVHHIRRNLSNALSYHFEFAADTVPNPYFRIDAFVFSYVFLEKVDRYSDDVYRFSEYLVQNHFHFQKYGFDEIKEAVFEFDVYRTHPEFKKKIQSINPPLSQSQLEQAQKSTEKHKPHQYLFGRKMQPLLLNSQLEEHRGMLARKVKEVAMKYGGTLNNYDFVSQVEARREQAKSRARGVWEQPEESLGGQRSLRRRVKGGAGSDSLGN